MSVRFVVWSCRFIVRGDVWPRTHSSGWTVFPRAASEFQFTYSDHPSTHKCFGDHVRFAVDDGALVRWNPQSDSRDSTGIVMLVFLLLHVLSLEASSLSRYFSTMHLPSAWDSSDWFWSLDEKQRLVMEALRWMLASQSKRLSNKKNAIEQTR